MAGRLARYLIYEMKSVKPWSVFHLPKNAGNSGWDVNGTRLFGSLQWKLSGINGIPEKVAPFSRWKLPNGNLCSIYRCLIFITSSIPCAVF